MSGRRKRILYVETARAVGGSSLSLLELVRGLAPDRYEPVVLFYYNTPAVQQFRDSGIKVLVLDRQVVASVGPTVNNQGASPPITRDVEGALNRYGRWLGITYRYGKEAYWLARRDWPLAQRLARLLRHEAIDLVHHNNSLRGNQGAILGARLVGLPQVCHVRMLHPYPALAPLSQRFVNAFIYISQAVAQSYLAWGIPKVRGRVIHNPISLAAFDDNQATHERAALRRELGLAPQDKVISNVGRLSWWKGQDYFIQAMATVVRTEPQARALIVGEPSTASPKEVAYYDGLQQLVQHLHLTNHVTFTGFRTDVPRIMAASDVVVHSASEPEPFGRVIVEAMMAGRPLVATAAGGVLEIVEDQETGLLAPPKDAAAMANAITYLLQNPAVAAQVGAAARQRAAARFTVEQHVRQVEAVYEEVLAGAVVRSVVKPVATTEATTESPK